MKFTVIFVIFGYLICSCTAFTTDKLFCYYGSWATYRLGNGKVEVEDIDPNLCTHIVYTFLGLDYDGSVKILDSWNEISKRALERFLALKNRNPNVKLLIAIGGWNEGSQKYSRMASSVTLRAHFIQSVLKFMEKYKFDGFDIDWEYPGLRGGASTDREAFSVLLKELRSEFDKRNLLLTAAVAATKKYHITSYDVPILSKYLHYINVMTYDFHGSYDGVTGQCSPLYASDIDQDKNLNVADAIQGWIEAGADPSKLILGIALYGRTYTLLNPIQNTLGSKTTGPGLPGRYSSESGMLTYLEICEQQNQGGWTVVWDNQQKNPYAYKASQWVGYDNVKSVVLKTKYAIEHKLGGVMIWSIESDDVHNSCKTGSYPLLRAIHGTLESASHQTDTTTQSTSTTTVSSSTSTIISTSSSSSSSSFSSSSTPSSTSTSSSPTNSTTPVPSSTPTPTPTKPNPSSSSISTSTTAGVDPTNSTASVPSSTPTPTPTKPNHSSSSISTSTTAGVDPTNSTASVPSSTPTPTPTKPNPSSSSTPSSTNSTSNTTPGWSSTNSTQAPSSNSSSAYKPSTTTPSSTTTVSPNSLCTREGYIIDPNNCSIFYYCRRQGLKYEAVKFICPAGLYYDIEKNMCNWPQLVDCHPDNRFGKIIKYDEIENNELDIIPLIL